MEIFTPAFWSSLIVIIGIDLFLAGDNAVVIAMAARRLPNRQREKAILYGTVGALVIRVLCTIGVVYLLMVPGLHFFGGLLLIWIAYRLLRPAPTDRKKKVRAATGLWGAIRTIIIADALMSLDNMLAVAGAAQNDPLLVICGLLVSVPLLMGGSAVIMKLIDRFPWLVYVGAAILAMTAGKMLFAEKLFTNLLGAAAAWAEWPVVILIIAGVLYFGWLSRKKNEKAHTADKHQAV